MIKKKYFPPLTIRIIKTIKGKMKTGTLSLAYNMKKKMKERKNKSLQKNQINKVSTKASEECQQQR